MTEDEYLKVQALTRYRAALEILRDVITEDDQALRVEVVRGLHRLIEDGHKAMGELEPGAEGAGPIRQTANLDGCDWRCPCGSSVSTSDGFGWERSRRELDEWLEEHQGHTDGTIQCVTSADGLRACSDPGVQTYPISKILGRAGRGL